MRCSYPCTDTEKTSIRRIGKGERRVLLEEYGRCAFVFPEGTPRSGGEPRYPILTEAGCFDCSQAKAAYVRMSQQLGKRQPATYRKQLLSRRRDLVRLALDSSDLRDHGNACNWSAAAAKRLQIRP